MAIVVTNPERFVAIIQDPEWAKQIFKTVERSRNIIMRIAAILEAEDIERLGMALRDWLAQIGGQGLANKALGAGGGALPLRAAAQR